MLRKLYKIFQQSVQFLRKIIQKLLIKVYSYVHIENEMSLYLCPVV